MSPDDVISQKRMRTTNEPEDCPLKDVTNHSTLASKPTVKNLSKISRKKTGPSSPGKYFTHYFSTFTRLPDLADFINFVPGGIVKSFES